LSQVRALLGEPTKSINYEDYDTSSSTAFSVKVGVSGRALANLASLRFQMNRKSAQTMGIRKGLITQKPHSRDDPEQDQQENLTILHDLSSL
jgi:hypothetical protein